MERLWNSGGKNWTYEYKYRRGGKTLCGLYAKKPLPGVPGDFREEEAGQSGSHLKDLSPAIRAQYEQAQTYHDGKWVMFHPEGTTHLEEYMQLLALKRKPNRT